MSARATLGVGLPYQLVRVRDGLLYFWGRGWANTKKNKKSCTTNQRKQKFNKALYLYVYIYISLYLWKQFISLQWKSAQNIDQCYQLYNKWRDYIVIKPSRSINNLIVSNEKTESVVVELRFSLLLTYPPRTCRFISTERYQRKICGFRDLPASILVVLTVAVWEIKNFQRDKWNKEMYCRWKRQQL